MRQSETTFVVGVTQRVEVNEQTGEVRDAIDQQLFVWLTDAGFLPVQVPNGLIRRAGALENWVREIKPKAIILSGGNDIGQCTDRDATEQYLIGWCAQHQLPMLGICRGLQMMASQEGSALQRVDGHVRTRHELIFNGMDRDFPANVNSYHNWAPTECPPGFEVMAVSEDSSIEAIKHKDLPWEGWMWHPEREHPFHHTDTERINRLFRG